MIDQTKVYLFDIENTLKKKTTNDIISVQIISETKKLFGPTIVKCIDRDTGNIFECDKRLLFPISLEEPQVVVRYAPNSPVITTEDINTIMSVSNKLPDEDPDKNKMANIINKLLFYRSYEIISKIVDGDIDG